MTTIALSKARGTLRPVRRGEALEGLSDASQWLLDTLRGWRRRSRGHHRFARARRAHMPRDIGITRADALYPSSNPFRKE
ncbi:MAG TPA: hypothetical protein VLJ17_12740 [Xanthobacteraceae bacterium]|nr:hypothetical protein [Xanthobacteraceae bacterium]